MKCRSNDSSLRSGVQREKEMGVRGLAPGATKKNVLNDIHCLNWDYGGFQGWAGFFPIPVQEKYHARTFARSSDSGLPAPAWFLLFALLKLKEGTGFCPLVSKSASTDLVSWGRERAGIPGCCSGCLASCCSDSPTGSSWRCCSSYHRD